MLFPDLIRRGVARLPPIADAEVHSWAEKEAQAVGMDGSSTYWIRYMAADGELRGLLQPARPPSRADEAALPPSAAVAHEARIAKLVLQKAFLSLGQVSHLLLATQEPLPRGVTTGLPGIAQLLGEHGSGSATLYEVARERVVPAVVVRRAREEDHDDLTPVLQRGAKHCPALATLPVAEASDQEFTLARLIAKQDADNSILVAEVAGRLVGLMAITSTVDVAPLLGSFDLDAQDGLTTPETYAQIRALAIDIARQRLLEELAQHAQQEGGEVHLDASAPLDPLAIGNAMADLLADESNAAKVRPNAFAVTLLCVDPGFEWVSGSLLAQAFETYGELEYCMVTLPHHSPQPRALRDFTRVPALPSISFPEVVFIFHRAGLSGPVRVRLAQASDRHGVEALVEGMSTASQVLESFDVCQPRSTAVVAICDGELIALATMLPTVEVDKLTASALAGPPPPPPPRDLPPGPAGSTPPSPPAGRVPADIPG